MYLQSEELYYNLALERRIKLVLSPSYKSIFLLVEPFHLVILYS